MWWASSHLKTKNIYWSFYRKPQFGWYCCCWYFCVQHLLLLPFEASMKYKQQKKPSVEKQVQKSSIHSNKVFKYRHLDGMDERIDDVVHAHTHIASQCENTIGDMCWLKLIMLLHRPWYLSICSSNARQTKQQQQRLWRRYEMKQKRKKTNRTHCEITVANMFWASQVIV